MMVVLQASSVKGVACKISEQLESQMEIRCKTEGTLDGCEKGVTEIGCSGVCVENHHPIHREQTTVLDHDRGQELLVKLYISS